MLHALRRIELLLGAVGDGRRFQHPTDLLDLLLLPVEDGLLEAGSDQRDDSPIVLPSGPPVTLRRARRRANRVVTDDQIDLADIEPLLPDGRGDEHVVLARAELFDHCPLLLLGHPLLLLPFAR